MPSVKVARKASSDPLRNFRFLVTFTKRTVGKDDVGTDLFLGRAGFMAVSGIGVQTEAIPYREGGYNTTTHKMPAQSDFPPMAFRRGMFDYTADQVGPAAWNWMREIFNHSQGTGVGDYNQDFRSDVTINVLEHPRADWSQESVNGQIKYVQGRPENMTEVRSRVQITAFNAWPTSIVFSDLDAGGNAIMVEQMTLVHEGLDISWATDSSGIPV